ncbi:chitobiase/beta-hexosaminidase C-terminal domain-containing protein [uncultured Treponema sp.]|uniref:chitobiase/beta-hexosaminidase C-terminal domain-containing protein n=1 Tax=uncultured Treponema sp. TaxID=162155 RepID=UPI0025FD1895|nr:chitobiase/beta-hexosaminidase C-terminal domain-containing protein [uncultured Treponema sp.]
MKVNIRNLFKGILVAASIFAIAACSSDDDDSGESEKPIASVVMNGGTQNADGTYGIAENDSVTLSCETAGAAIKYVFSDTEITAANIDKAGFKNVGSNKKVQITGNSTLYAYAELNDRKSELKSWKFVVLPVPSKPEFTPSAPADKDTGLYPYGTTVTIASTSSVTDDVVKIYYSTTTELTASNAATAGTEYTSAAVIKIEKPLKLSAIAKGTNGWSKVTTVDYDCSIVYAEGEFEENGNIAKAVDAINGKEGASFGDGLELKGYVTLAANKVSSGKPYIYIQDKNAGIQIYNIDTSVTTYAIGDYVTVQGANAGMIYETSGVTEITTFGSIEKDDSKATRKIFYKKIPSYFVDFREFMGAGTLLRGFVAKANEHTSTYDNIYTAGANPAADVETLKLNIGPVVYASAKYQFSVWTQLAATEADLDIPDVENVKATTSKAAKSGYYEAGTVVTFECDTTGADIYYSTTEFARKDFDPSSTQFTKASSYTVNDDVTLFTIAVKGTEKSQVKMFEYLTAFDTTFVALDETNNYALDGNLAALAKAQPTDASDTKYSGYIVAYNGSSNKQYLVQDKSAGVYFYNVSLPTNARVGSKIEFTVTKGSVYSGLYEVTGANITVTEPKSTDKIYYINLTGKDDFTTYTTGQLCAVNGKAADYKDAKATVYTQKDDDGTAKSFFGYVYNRTPQTGDATIQLAEMFHKAEGTVPMPAGYVYAPDFSVASGSSVNSGTTVTLTCKTAGAAIYYTTDGNTPTSASTAYTTPITLTADVTIKAIAISDGNSSEVSSASYTVLAAGVTPVVKATLDFTNPATTWGIPKDAYSTEEATYTYGTYSVKLSAGSKALDNALIYGKQGAYVSLPAFDWTTTKIVVKGSSSGGAKVTQNIFVGDTAVSTQTTSAKVDHEYDIASAYQAAGNVYVIKVTNANNSQLTGIEIWGY